LEVPDTQGRKPVDLSLRLNLLSDQHGIHVDSSVAALLVAGVQGAPKGGGAQLTVREIDVLKLAADGLSNNQIADRLAVTALAAKGHFVRIGRKLSAHDRTQMVAEAMRADLLR
jgi:DNA-binding NarL/FixJ family response regulator